MKVSQRIRAWLQEGEDILTSLLGLIIAISGLIAFADVFSSGKALTFLPWLLWVWIVSQAIAVDYQFYITVKRQFTASNVDKFVYWTRWALIVILGALVVVVGAVFAVSETQGGAISASMQVLGIPMIAFMYARAAAPVLLLFVIGVDHAMDRKQPAQVQAVPTITPDVLNVLIQRLDNLTVEVTQLTNPNMPAVPRIAERKEPDEQEVPRLTWNEDGKVETVQFPGKEPVQVDARAANLRESAEPQGELTGTTTGTDERLTAAYHTLRTAGYSISGTMLAQVAHVRKQTAIEWLRTVEQQKED